MPVHPSILRNREPLRAALAPHLGPLAAAGGLLLELASGTGDLAAWLAPHFPGLRWLPTDLRPGRFDPDTPAPPSVLPPRALDAAAPVASWPLDLPAEQPGAILCINMVHISPWAATLGLLAGAGQLLPPDGRLILYGPYLRGLQSTPGNITFDLSLRAQDPDWGVRELDAVLRAAREAGLSAVEVVEMPANNLTLVLGPTAGR